MTLFLSLVTLKKLQPSSMRNFIKELRYCQEDLTTIIQKTKCHPILLRLAWSDAGLMNIHLLNDLVVVMMTSLVVSIL